MKHSRPPDSVSFASSLAVCLLISGLACRGQKSLVQTDAEVPEQGGRGGGTIGGTSASTQSQGGGTSGGTIGSVGGKGGSSGGSPGTGNSSVSPPWKWPSESLPPVGLNADWVRCVGDWPDEGLVPPAQTGKSSTIGPAIGSDYSFATFGDPVPLRMGNRLAISGLVPVILHDPPVGQVPFDGVRGPYGISVANPVGISETDAIGAKGGVMRFTALPKMGVTLGWTYPIEDPFWRATGESANAGWMAFRGSSRQLFFGSNTGYVYSLDVDNADQPLVWKSAVRGGIASYPTVQLGIGDVVIVRWQGENVPAKPLDNGSFAVSVNEGKPVGRFWVEDGGNVVVTLATARLGFVGTFDKSGQRWIVYVDLCGKEIRRIPALPTEVPVLAMSGDRILTSVIRYDQTPAEYVGRILGPEGVELAAYKSDLRFNPMLEGADGAIYVLSCDINSPVGEARFLDVFDDKLAKVNTLPLTFGERGGTGRFRCPSASADLSASGILSMVVANDAGATVIQMQTSSKGLSKGGWPTRLGDARNTRWGK
jgi:hypothetical protein